MIAAVDGDLDQLRRRDLPPFAAAIAAGVQAVMPGHLLVPGLTGGLPATWSAAALTGLLRGELGFTGAIVSDALEMRAVSDPYGVPEAAVRTVAAGADLLCLGRDQDEEMYLAVRTALAAAVAEGRLPAARLEEAAAGYPPSVPGWPGAVTPARCPPAGPRPATTAPGRPDRGPPRPAGLRPRRPPADPLVVEFSSRRNIAVGTVPWGLGPWLDGNVQRLDTSQGEASLAGAVADVLARAAGRPLVIVVRDAHRHPAHARGHHLLLAARPDAVVVEMGLPVWRPPGGAYVATYGAARPNAQAAAESWG